MSDKRWETWRGAFKVAIRVVEDDEPLPDPKIVCTACGELLTYLADMDTVASLMTLAAEHRCPAS